MLCGDYHGGMSSVPDRALRAVAAPKPIRVVNWPLRDGGLQAWLMLLGLGGAAAAAGWLAGSGMMGGLCFVAMLLAAWRLWIPVTYELGAKGIIQEVLGRARQIPWAQLVNYEEHPLGISLLLDDTPALAPMHSLFIYWSGQREELLKVIEFYTQVRSVPASTKDYVKPSSAAAAVPLDQDSSKPVTK